MRNFILVLFAGCVVGCGVGDGTIDPEEIQSGQTTEAVTTYNGFCQTAKFGSIYKLSGVCTYNNGVSCVLNQSQPNPACKPFTWANNHTSTPPCGLVDMTRPCSFSQ